MQKNKVLNLVNDVTARKKNPRDKAYVHVKIKEKVEGVKVGEIAQLLEYNFKSKENTIYCFDAQNEVVMLLNNDTRQSLALFDKVIYEHFPSDKVHVTAAELNESGLHSLASIIDRVTPANDDVARTALKRMRRTANCFLVLDDDLMVLKTMENILKGFGTVHTTQKADEFVEFYKEYAPNIVFVDIHLGRDRGSQVVQKIVTDLDPYVHAIMISSDSAQDTVLEVKAAGAKGFIVKPFTRETVYKHLMNAPSFVQKTF